VKNPKFEILGTLTRSGFTCRNPSHIRSPKFELGLPTTRSVLDCGGPPPLFPATAMARPAESARGLAHSMTWRSIAVLFALLRFVSVVHAQTNYTIDWFTVDGGGATSTGGVYSVSGTIGQPDAHGPLTNGQYSVTGGFWALYAVQTEGAPWLSIVPAGPGQATISWTPPAPGFVLQESLSLSPAAWTNSPSGATNPVVVPATLPAKFYRLRKP